MKYLLVCDHRKQIVEHSNPSEAKKMLNGKTCCGFNLKDQKWRFRDVRVFIATPKDVEIVAGGKSVKSKARFTEKAQLDWVGGKS